VDLSFQWASGVIKASELDELENWRAHTQFCLLSGRSISTSRIGPPRIHTGLAGPHHVYLPDVSRRRALRPSEEYRNPTDTEWDDFVDHFAQGKLELGGYGTPCAHEHACIRCPMLRPYPAQKPGLEEIAVNLEERIKEAQERGWKGENERLHRQPGRRERTTPEDDRPRPARYARVASP
jgi:hypothetical protein